MISANQPVKRVIVNADDFGFDSHITHGIIEAHQRGAVTSASLMVNMPAAGEAVALAKQNPKLGVGLHINLTYGRPVVDPSLIPSLVNTSGYFLGIDVFLKKLFLGQIRRADIIREIQAQFEKFFTFGIECTHFDGHRHIHTVPRVYRIASKEALARGVRKCRIPYETETFQMQIGKPQGSRLEAQYLKSLLLKLWIRKTRKICRQTGLVAPENFFGITAMSDTTSGNNFTVMLNHCRPGTNEIMCHPGLAMENADSLDGYATQLRQRELDLLKDQTIKMAIENNQIQMISFREL